MKILFNLMKCGLGNNGGSSTIIKSANTLQKLGHDVYILDSSKPNYTWGPIEVPHIITNNLNDAPEVDVSIATGFSTVRWTMNLPPKCGVKTHWIRGFELWNMSEKEIISKVLNPSTKKIVNSICLQNKLKDHGFESEIIRPGYDFDNFNELKIRNKTNEIIIIGGLYNEGSKRSTKRVHWIFDAVRILKRQHRIQLWMFGNESKPNVDIIDKYFQRPDIKTKNTFYNHINLWLSPTELEGSHMPPAEAMLTGCPVICTNAKMSGMQDFMISGETGLVSENTFESFCNTIDHLLRNRNELFHYGTMTRKNIIKLGSREENMKKMVEYFEKLIN